MLNAGVCILNNSKIQHLKRKHLIYTLTKYTPHHQTLIEPKGIVFSGKDNLSHILHIKKLEVRVYIH